MSASDPLVLLVSGLPGAGKSTLVRSLAAELGWPTLCKDVIKEALYDSLGVGDRTWSRRLGAAASEAMWALLADQPGHVLVESVFSTAERSLIEGGLQRAEATRVAQVVCDCPADEALRRFWLRVSRGERHHGHAQSPEQVDEQDEARWQRLAADSFDLGLGPLLRVDTTRPVDVLAVVDWIRQMAASSP